LRANFQSRNGTIFRHKPNFIDLDAVFSGQRGLQLLCKGAWLGVPTWERTHESRELRLCGAWREVDAGDTRTGQQLRETFFRARRAQRHAVEENLAS
jgi:hypothetical protein